MNLGGGQNLKDRGPIFGKIYFAIYLEQRKGLHFKKKRLRESWG